MKKYTNITNAMVCVEFEGVAQFLRRGQSVTNDLKVIKLPKSVLVEDLTPTKVIKTKTAVKKTTETKPKSIKKAK